MARLGLRFTSQERDFWRDRWNDAGGIYRNPGDVNSPIDKPGSPGDRARILADANAFKANPGNYDYDDYYKGAGAWVAGGGENPDANNCGYYMACSAFVSLMYETSDPTLAATYALPVYNMLKNYMDGTGFASFTLNGVTKKAFDWSDTVRFPGWKASGQGTPGWGEVTPGFIIAEGMEWHMQAYEYIKNYSGWTTSERERFRVWVDEFGKLMLRDNEGGINALFVNRANKNYLPPSSGEQAVAGSFMALRDNGATHAGHRKQERYFGNKRATMYGVGGQCGIFASNNATISTAKKFFEDMYRFSIWPSGLQTDSHRSDGQNDPLTGLEYSIMGSMFNFIDALARTGDFGDDGTFGYNWSTKEGTLPSAATAGDGQFYNSGFDASSDRNTLKGPKLTCMYLAKCRIRRKFTYFSPSSHLYGNNDPAMTIPGTTNGRRWRYSGVDPTVATGHSVHDLQLLVASKFYENISYDGETNFGQFLRQVALREYNLGGGASVTNDVVGSMPWPTSGIPNNGHTKAFCVARNVGTAFMYDNTVTKGNIYPSTINKLVIDFPTIAAKTYGDAAFALNATVTNAVGFTVTYSISSTPAGIGSISGGNYTINGAGSVTITANATGNATYADADSVQRTFVVAKKDVTCTIQNASRKYNRANPAFTAVYTGFKAGEDASALDTLATFSCPTATLGSTVGGGSGTGGAYPITKLTDAADNNYSFIYVNGLLTLTKGVLELIANDINKLTSDVPFTPTFSVVEQDTPANVVSSVTMNFTLFSGTSVTSIGLTTALVTLSGTAGVSVMRFASLANTNYFIFSRDRNITVNTGTPTPIAQTITGFSPTGGTYGDGTSTLTATGGASGNPVVFSSGDISIATCTGTNGTTLTRLKAGIVTLTATQAGTTSGTIYDAATPVQVNITIAQKGLTVTADNKSKTYGAANPMFTYLVSGGFVGSDTAAVFTAAPVPSSSATQNSNVGTYSIVPAGFSAENYSFTYVNGTLTISKANQTIIGFDSLANKRANDLPFNLPGSSTGGLALTYTKNSGPGAVTVSSIGLVTINGVTGTVNITASQAGDGNYNAATSVTRDLVIDVALPVPQTITINTESLFVFGDPDFAVDASSTSGKTLSVEIIDEVPKGVLAAATVPTTSSITGAGTMTLRFYRDADADHLAAEAFLVITINKKEQTITAPTIEDKLLTDPDFDVVASASSGLPLLYSTTSAGVITQAVNGSNPFHIVGLGVATIDIVQEGDDNYSPVQTSRVFNILPDNPDVVVDVLSGEEVLYGNVPYQTTRSDFFYRVIGLSGFICNRVVITFKLYNVPKRFKVFIHNGTALEEVVSVIDNTSQIYDYTFPVAKSLLGEFKITAVGTNLKFVVVKAELFGIVD